MVYCTLHRDRGRRSFSNISYIQTIAYNNQSCRRQYKLRSSQRLFSNCFPFQRSTAFVTISMATTASYLHILYLLIMALNIIHLLTYYLQHTYLGYLRPLLSLKVLQYHRVIRLQCSVTQLNFTCYVIVLNIVYLISERCLESPMI